MHYLYNFNFNHASGGGLRNARTHIKDASDLFSFSHLRNAARLDISRLGALRTASVSESGFRGTVDEQVGQWQKVRDSDTTRPMIDGTNVQQILHPRIGIGLPMSYIYATYGTLLPRACCQLILLQIFWWKTRVGFLGWLGFVTMPIRLHFRSF